MKQSTTTISVNKNPAATAPLEQRVAALERQLAEMKSQQGAAPGKEDWRQTVGMFTDDPEMLELFAEAMKLREADRKKARRRVNRRRVKS
jgi:hypothetical protein